MFIARRLLASAALAGLLVSPAYAASQQEITDALIGALTAAGAEKIAYDGPAVDGDTLTYGKISFTFDKPAEPGEDPAGPYDVTIDQLVLTGADIPADADFSAASIALNGLVATSTDGVARLAEAGVDNLVVVAPTDVREAVTTLDSFSASDFRLESEGKAVVTVDTLAGTASDYVGTQPRHQDVAVKRIVFDPAALPDPAAGQQLSAIGYDKLIFDFSSKMDWNVEEEVLEVENVTIDGVEIGTLTMAMSLGGITPEVFEAFNKRPEPDFGALTGTTLSAATIAFTDKSVTGRILEKQAREAGTDAASFANQLAAVLPLMLSSLGNPAFQTAVATALGDFLKNPRSLTVTAAPAQPVPFVEVMAIGQTAPQTLPDLLNVTVESGQ